MKTIKIDDLQGTTHLINSDHIISVEAYGGIGVMVNISGGVGIKTELTLSEVENQLKSK
jgi:hypothetical protein|tara:strand:- start:3582 stop:3758 length:177 start_codon:yes stop_codon:yes gene_type:complete